MNARLALLSISVACVLCTGARAENGLDARQLLISKIETDGDLITLPVIVADQQLRFVIDTGSTTTALDEHFREKLTPVEPKTDLERLTVEGGAEIFASPGIIVRGTEKGTIGFPDDMPITIRDLSEDRNTSAREFQGILGMDFLAHYAVELDLHQGRFCLMDSKDVVPQEGDQVVEFETAARRAVVDLFSPGLAYWGLVDTGAVLTLDLEEEAYLELFKRQELRRFAATVGPDNRLAYTSAARLHGVQMGRFVHFGLVVGRHDVTLLGLHYWRRFHCLFDFPRKQMYLRPSPYFTLRDEGDRCGIALRDDSPPGKPKQVRLILQDSVAERQGLRAGDTLISVDGLKTDEMTELQIYLRIKLRSRELKVVAKTGDDPPRELILPAPIDSVPSAVIMDAKAP